MFMIARFAPDFARIFASVKAAALVESWIDVLKSPDLIASSMETMMLGTSRVPWYPSNLACVVLSGAGDLLRM